MMAYILLITLQFSYIGIFAVVFAESGFLLGFFLPGDSLLFTAGLLAAHGIFNIWILVPMTIVAAILGDSFGYYWGRKLGPKIFIREDSFLFHKKHVERTKAFFDKHGKKTIILARFIPIVRTFAPIFAGVGDMAYSTFLSFNIVGGIIWGGGVLLVGFFLGTAFPGIEQFLSYIILAILALSVYPVAREFFPEKSFLRKVLAVNVFSFLFFDVLAACVNTDFLRRIDVSVSRQFLGTAGTFTTRFMEVVTNIMSPEIFFGLLVVAFVVFLSQKKYRDFFVVSIATLGGALGSQILKIIFHIPRPAFALLHESNFSFPSGHATMAVIFFGLWFFFVREKPVSKITFYLVNFFAFFLPLLIGFSRIYLGVHWLSDVLAGYALGLFWITCSVLVMHLYCSRFGSRVRV